MNKEENDHPDDLPNNNIDTEDKIRIIKGLVLLLLFASIVISSMIYYNAPNYNPNLVFEGEHNVNMKYHKHLHENPIYRLSTRFTSKNYIQLDLINERKGKNNKIQSELIKNIRLIIKFSKTKARIQVFSLENEEWSIPKSLFNNNDLDLDSENKIDNIEDSNIGVRIINHPFSFYLYNKVNNEILFDTTHSNESDNFDHYFYYSKGYVQISTRLPIGHYTYGLGERFQNIRMNNGIYSFWASDNGGQPGGDDNTNDNLYSSIPNFLTINPKTNYAFGAVLFNSSPIEVVLKDDYLTYKMTSGKLELYIFTGPRPREVIIQNQETFGRPIVPPYSALGWNGIIYLNEGNEIKELTNTLLSKVKGENKTLPWEGIWLDNYYDLNDDKINVTMADMNKYNYTFYLNKFSPVLKNEKYVNYEIAKESCIKDKDGNIINAKIPLGDSCFIDYFNPLSLLYLKKTYLGNREFVYDHTQVTLYMNEPSYICPNCKSDYNMVYTPSGLDLEKNTLPLNAIQNNGYILLNTHNLYALTETKTYYTALTDVGIIRPVIFSRSYFTGMQQYAGKWMGFVADSWKGLKSAITQSLNFNLFGNPIIMHDACGNSKSKKTLNMKKNSIDKELCLRWLQFASLNPIVRVNNFEILHMIKEDSSFISAISIRYQLMMYIYTIMVKNYLEGGAFLQPMFIDFKSSQYQDILNTMENQFMLGSNIMVSPVITPGERKKKTYFPDELFYNLQNGKLMNPNGEGFIQVDAQLDYIPIFCRAGFVTPIQDPIGITKVSELKNRPFEVILALDGNLRAAGRIFFDDGYSDRMFTKREYYRMDIIANQIANNKIEVIFKYFDYNFKKDLYEYPYINNIRIYGIKNSIKKISKSFMDNNQIKTDEIIYNNYKQNEYKALFIKMLELPLVEKNSYKIIIELDNY